MLRLGLVLASLLALSACATPRETCLASAQRSVRVIDNLVAQTHANLARGYAIREVERVGTVPDRCYGRTEDGVAVAVRCDRPVSRIRRVPVAIDLEAEQAKLESLLERQAVQHQAAQQAVQQCVALYPA